MLAFTLFVLAMVSVTAPILARHRGTCPECRNPIRVDDLIIEVKPKVWVHEECAPTEFEENWGWPERQGSGE